MAKPRARFESRHIFAAVLITALAMAMLGSALAARWDGWGVWLLGPDGGALQGLSYLITPGLAGVGIWLLNRRTKAQEQALAIDRQGRLDERFKVGTEMLGSESLGQQFGGAAILRNLVLGAKGAYAVETLEFSIEMLESTSARWHANYDTDLVTTEEILAAQSERANLERLNSQLVKVISSANNMVPSPPVGGQSQVRRYARNVVMENSHTAGGSLAGINFHKVRCDECSFFRVNLASAEMYDIIGVMHASQCQVMDSQFTWRAERKRGKGPTGTFAYTTGPRLGVIADHNEIRMNCCEVTQASIVCHDYSGMGCYFIGYPPTIQMEQGLVAVAKVDSPPNNETTGTYVRDWKAGAIYFFDKDYPEGKLATAEELEKYYAGRMGFMRI